MIGDLHRTKITLNQSSDNSLIPGSIPTSSRPRPSSRPRTGEPSPPSLFACLFGIILIVSCGNHENTSVHHLAYLHSCRYWHRKRAGPGQAAHQWGDHRRHQGGQQRVQGEFRTGGGRDVGGAGHLEERSGGGLQAARRESWAGGSRSS